MHLTSDYKTNSFYFLLTINLEVTCCMYYLMGGFKKNNNTPKADCGFGEVLQPSLPAVVFYRILFYISDVQLIHSLVSRRTPVFLPGC